MLVEDQGAIAETLAKRGAESSLPGAVDSLDDQHGGSGLRPFVHAARIRPGHVAMRTAGKSGTHDTSICHGLDPVIV